MKNNHRNTHRQRSRAPSRSVGLLGLLLLALLLPTAATAQTPPKRIDPRNPDAGTLQMIAQHVLTGCKPGIGNLTGEIHPLGKLSTAGPVAWLLDRVRCDTTFGDASKQPRDLLLVRAVDGAIPPLDSAERIGASELGSVTEFVCASDLDGNGHQDLICTVRQLNDTSFGPSVGYEYGKLVIFWSSSKGKYSIADTTQVSNGTQAWFGPDKGISGDFDNDGIGDGLVLYASGLVNGTPITKGLPGGYLLHGGHRWSGEEQSNKEVLGWWSVPSQERVSSIEYLDADCDGWKDLVFFNTTSAAGSISICYGRPNAFPDTNNIQTVTLPRDTGWPTLLTDVTGDGVPELIVAATFYDQILVFAGKAGQRLLEQYGSGNDSLDRAQGRFPTRPWVRLWMPSHLHDGWFKSISTYDLGDVSGDGAKEIWTISHPYLLGYVTGTKLDSLVDVLADAGDYRQNIGLIDGSRSSIICIGYRDGRVTYQRAVGVPQTWGSEYRLPHDTGYRCQYAASAVASPAEAPSTENSWQLQVVPQPAHGHATIHWNTEQTADTLYLTIHDVLGRQVWQTTIPEGQSSIEWNTANLVGGVYTITLANSQHATTITTLIQQH
ncbi:MAG: T9SS type A sorting domain-containing protein [Chlorobi bacterium]|nr:T9SS type A sorting domain-containing protein [Chlorobiota bacterium]